MTALPSSLSPHICVLSSPDLSELLKASSLPPLPEILQSFSPLPQVTTRTTSLSSVPHASFALRFSDLEDIETASKEDEERRAARTFDWIAARISHRCTRWVNDIEKLPDKDVQRTPWWEELRRCVEGDHVPSRRESWNHPAAVILAVSTAAPNPLQAITTLQARPLDFPPWVDRNYLRSTLIVHPKGSPLSDEEAGALYNAVRKQFGLESYLLSLDMPSPPPPPVPVPALMPRLPHPPSDDMTDISPTSATPMTPSFPIPGSPPGQQPATALNTLKLAETDIQSTAKFTREFVVMSLIPWMERCVTEWNENFSSTRRLPSRLFSSTRRLFGSASPSPAPAHRSSGSVAGQPVRSNTVSGLEMSQDLASQQRRLAEFATILGDFKLAVNVWETLRKDLKGGSDMLPLLLSPSPTISLHASTALANLHPPAPELPPHIQLRSLLFAIRWASGISMTNFLSEAYEGERWLVWAARNSEEPPSALLVAQAALLSVRKGLRRRGSLWYLDAATRLEKSGIKPLTMYFLRRAHELYIARPEKSLSPSFWDSEGVTPSLSAENDRVIRGIEHPLGRLLYNTGDTAAAVKTFLGLLRGSTIPHHVSHSAAEIPSNDSTRRDQDNVSNLDKMFLQDFQVAFQHLVSVAGGPAGLKELHLPISLCQPKECKLRLPRDMSHGDHVLWEKLEDQWKSFWRDQGHRDSLVKSGRADVNEYFWVDVVFHNPLDAEISLSKVTLVVDELEQGRTESDKHIQVETIRIVPLGPMETRTIPISIKVSKPTALKVTHVQYEFLSLLPCEESLAVRGKRLHDTPQQRQRPTYAPDQVISVEIAEASNKLVANFIDREHLHFAQGELLQLRLIFSNMGTAPINEIWMVSDADDEIWLRVEDKGNPKDSNDQASAEELTSPNHLLPMSPYQIPLALFCESSVLQPEDSIEIPAFLRISKFDVQDVNILLVHRESEGKPFHAARLTQSVQVNPLLELSLVANPSQSDDHLFTLTLELENVSDSDSVCVSQISTLSPTWECRRFEGSTMNIGPFQSSRMMLSAVPRSSRHGDEETIAYVANKIQRLLSGSQLENNLPPLLNVGCQHVLRENDTLPRFSPMIEDFLQRERRRTVLNNLTSTHQHIPFRSLPYIFPLYNPLTVDIVAFWEIPSQSRSGHCLLSSFVIGARHESLREIIDETENAKAKRSMYSETTREKIKILESIRHSEWNSEMNPLVISVRESGTIDHGFSGSPCQIPVHFAIQNHSLTHSTIYVLNLKGDSLSSRLSAQDLLEPPYIGRLLHRGILEPAKSVELTAKLWVTRAGCYSLGGWSLQSDVLEPGGTSKIDGTVRHRYVQVSSSEDCITVCSVDEGKT